MNGSCISSLDPRGAADPPALSPERPRSQVVLTTGDASFATVRVECREEKAGSSRPGGARASQMLSERQQGAEAVPSHSLAEAPGNERRAASLGISFSIQSPHPSVLTLSEAAESTKVHLVLVKFFF